MVAASKAHAFTLEQLLGTIAHHGAMIMVQKAPYKGTWGVGEVAISVEISKCTGPDPIWDAVKINGVECGNRHGGVRAFGEACVDAIKAVA